MELGRWVVAALSVAGAFLFGVAGALCVSHAGVPVETGHVGFACALLVVSTAYRAAPRSKRPFAVVVFGCGALVAWGLLRPVPPGEDLFLEQTTWTPLLATLGGGAPGLLGALGIDARRVRQDCRGSVAATSAPHTG
jgi:hypothetical protein